MKKIFSLFLILILFISSFVGCNSSNSGNESNELIIWSVEGPLYPGYENMNTGDSKITKYIVDSFIESHPGMEIKIINMGNGTQLHSALQQAYITNQLPDITVGESMIKSQAELGYFDEINLSEDLKNNIRDEFFEMSRIGGKQYGVPFTAGVPELLYNETLLKQALNTDDRNLFEQNGDFIPPTDLDELLIIAQNVCNYFKNNNQSEIGGMLINNVKGLSSAFRGQYIMSLFGGSWYDNKGNLKLDTEENIKAFSYMRNMKKASSEGNVAYSTENDCISAFLSGRCAFAIEHPAMLADYTGQFGEIKVSSLPTAGEKESSSVLVGTLSYMMTTCCRNKNAAKDFLNLLASKDVQEQIYVNSSLRLPIRKDVAAELLQSNDNDVLSRHKFYKPGLNAVYSDNLVFGLPYFKTEQYTQIWNDNWSDFINKVFTGTTGIKQLLDQLQYNISLKI